MRCSEEHVHRLRLIRAVLEVGGPSTAAVREVLGELVRRRGWGASPRTPAGSRWSRSA
ncbi:hypothetical protein ABZY57_00740 [Streptomyces sp. NPDC006450]|uniref:hypothetical protein n=1 Tax=Streptomyces sp. NPDC006450 TaxID=3155458 RepID=UPI0033AE71AF